MPKYDNSVQLTSNGFVHAPSVFRWALDYKRLGSGRKWAISLLDGFHLPETVAKGLLDGKREYRIAEEEESVIVPVTSKELEAIIALSKRR